MRVGQPGAALTEVHAPWGLRFDHVVLQGTCWLTPIEGNGFAAVELGPGDVVLLGRGAAHAMVSAEGVPLAAFSPARDAPGAPFGRFVLPGTGARSTIVCGAYRLVRSRPHPLLRDLPEVLHLSALPGRHPGLRALVDLLGAGAAWHTARRRRRRTVPCGRSAGVPASRVAPRSCGCRLVESPDRSGHRAGARRCARRTGPRRGRSSSSPPSPGCPAPRSPAGSPRWSANRP
jgi:hypothetical protein